MDSLVDRVQELAREAGFFAIGVTSAYPPNDAAIYYRKWLDQGFGGEMHYLAEHISAKQNPELVLPEAKSAIVLGFSYNNREHTSAPPAFVKVARYAIGRDYHRFLKSRLKPIVREIERIQGAKARVCIDSAPVLERSLAQQAGIGWFGKNTCLINSQFGSFFFIATILTTLELQPDLPSQGGCGTCTKCIDACPTGAIQLLNDRWAVDSRRCISYLTIEKRGELTELESSQIGEWTFGCDICQEVCPFNEVRETQPLRAMNSAEPSFFTALNPPTLQEAAEALAESPENECTFWESLSQGRPIRRAGREGLLRNVRANLKNLAKPIECEDQIVD